MVNWFDMQHVVFKFLGISDQYIEYNERRASRPA